MTSIPKFLGTLLLILTASVLGADTGLMSQAEQSLNRRDYTNAIAVLNQLVNADVKNSRAYFLRGKAYSALNKPDQALMNYNTAIKLTPKNPALYQNRGLEMFKTGYFKKSVEDFDQFLRLVPAQKPYHWQRGIALYYAGDFEEGKKQFELHQTVNPNDVENSIWHFLCAARSGSLEQARSKMIPIDNDSRVPMMAIYGLFKGMQSREDVLRQIEGRKDSGSHAVFYAHLYLGLFEKLKGNIDQARTHFREASRFSQEMELMGDIADIEFKVLSDPSAAPSKFPKK